MDSNSVVFNILDYDRHEHDEHAQPPNTFAYSNLDDLVKDYINHLKYTKKMTLKVLAGRSGLSASLVSMYLRGARNLSQDATKKVIGALPLRDVEIDYVNLLYVANFSDSREEVLAALQKIQGANEFKRHRAGEEAVFKFISEPLNVVIRELVQLETFREDPKWIQSVLNDSVSTIDIKRSLLFLEENDFLKRDDDGKLVLAEREFKCLDLIQRLSLIDNHRDMLKRSMALLEKKDALKDITGQVVAIDSASFEEIKSILKEARKRIRDVEVKSLKEKRANMVLQVGLLAHPIAHDKKDGEE